MSLDAFFDCETTNAVFSPEGKLHQIEYAIRATKRWNQTTVAIKGAEGVVVATEKLADDLADNPTNLFEITENIGCVITGFHGDGVYLIDHARMAVLKGGLMFGNKKKSIDAVCSRISALEQISTEKPDLRPLATIMILITDDKIFKIDPSGEVEGFKAIAAGTKEDEGIAYLESHYGPDLSMEDTINLAIECLLHVRGIDVATDSSDIEIGMVTAEKKNFEVLTEKDIENHLAIIAKKQLFLKQG